jgi:hypothetical protein
VRPAYPSSIWTTQLEVEASASRVRTTEKNSDWRWAQSRADPSPQLTGKNSGNCQVLGWPCLRQPLTEADFCFRPRQAFSDAVMATYWIVLCLVATGCRCRAAADQASGGEFYARSERTKAGGCTLLDSVAPRFPLRLPQSPQMAASTRPVSRNTGWFVLPANLPQQALVSRRDAVEIGMSGRKSVAYIESRMADRRCAMRMVERCLKTPRSLPGPTPPAG